MKAKKPTVLAKREHEEYLFKYEEDKDLYYAVFYDYASGRKIVERDLLDELFFENDFQQN